MLEQTIGVPADVTPVAPSTEQKDPAVTEFCAVVGDSVDGGAVVATVVVGASVTATVVAGASVAATVEAGASVVAASAGALVGDVSPTAVMEASGPADVVDGSVVEVVDTDTVEVVDEPVTEFESPAGSRFPIS
ncbi:MAG: hypothetical protein AAF531_09865 [Actinomycetota bacterium]